MPDGPHILNVTLEQAGANTVARFRGEVDCSSADELTDTIRETSGPIVFDLTDVSFMDSSGIRALVEAQALAADSGRVFAICRPSPPVSRLLELIGLRGRIPEVQQTDGAPHA